MDVLHHKSRSPQPEKSKKSESKKDDDITKIREKHAKEQSASE